MTAPNWALAALLAAAPFCQAQALTYNERIIQLADVLGNGSDYSSREKLRAIEELAGARVINGLASGLLFDRANVQFESDPAVREAAALGLRHVCELRNRMFALRLARFTRVAQEPSPRVRLAALRALAAFDCADAAAAVYAAAEGGEPDPGVRAAAAELISKGQVASVY